MVNFFDRIGLIRLIGLLNFIGFAVDRLWAFSLICCGFSIIGFVNCDLVARSFFCRLDLVKRFDFVNLDIRWLVNLFDDGSGTVGRNYGSLTSPGGLLERSQRITRFGDL